MRSIVVFGFLLACGGSKPDPETPPPAASMVDCGQVSNHVAKTVAAEKPRPGATIEAVQSMVKTRCKADAWSDETKQCLQASATVKAARDCAATMTEAQRTAIAEAAKALRSDQPEPGAPASQSDWIEHVVEEPGTPTR